MIAALRFHHFRVLRSAVLRLGACNLVLGPSGSGKTSLLAALLQLRALADRPDALVAAPARPADSGPRIEFTFDPPYAELRLHAVGASEELDCDHLVVAAPAGAAGERLWAELRERLRTIRGYRFDPMAMALPAPADAGGELAADAGNFAAVLAAWRRSAPHALAALEAEFCRILPEFQRLDFRETGGRVGLRAQPGGSDAAVPADRLSQGTLALLALLTLAFTPAPPAVVCLEEADRGVHPRLLREVRDVLYRLSHPRPVDGGGRAPVQVVATTHSPYLLDLFRDHPEEIVFASKQGQAATFARLSDRADLVELLREAPLGDLWFSGLLGGVPGEP